MKNICKQCGFDISDVRQVENKYAHDNYYYMVKTKKGERFIAVWDDDFGWSRKLNFEHIPDVVSWKRICKCCT